MDESIVEDIKKALSRIDNRLPTPSQKRQALDCVKKVVENPPAKVAPPKKAIGRPASEIRKIFNESKKVIVGKRGPQSVQIAVDLLDKRIKWIEETLGEKVSREQIELYFKPELARIKIGKEKEGSSETDPIPKHKPKPKPETKPEPKKKPRGRPITTGKSLQPIEREKMGDEDPKIISAKRKEEEREQMREEDPQPKISWYENLDKTKEKAKVKVKAEKEAKAKPKRDEAQKELKKIAKQAQEQLKKAEKEEKKAKAKAEKEAEKAKVKAEKKAVKAEKAKVKAKPKAEMEFPPDVFKEIVSFTGKPKEKKFKSTYTNIIPWGILKPLGISKKLPEEWRKGLVKDENGLVAEIEDVKATKKGFIRTKFVFTLEKKDGNKKEFEINIEYYFDSKIADIIEDELEYDITDDEQEQESLKADRLAEVEQEEIEEQEIESEEPEPKKEKKKIAVYKEEAFGDGNYIPYENIPSKSVILKKIEDYLTSASKIKRKGVSEELFNIEAKKVIKKLENKPVKVERIFLQNAEDLFGDELEKMGSVEFDVEDDLEELEKKFKIEKFTILPERELSSIVENIIEKIKETKGSVLGSGRKKIYANSIMNTQERPDGLVKKVKKVVVKPTPVVIVDRFKKRDFGTAKGNGESQEMPINVPDVSIVPKLKNKGKVGLAPLQSKPRYEGAGNLRNRGFHTQNTKEFIESRYM